MQVLKFFLHFSNNKGVNMKKNLGLTTKIFIGLLLGAICGIILYGFVPAGVIRDDILINGVFKILGKGFLRAMQMLVAPLVYCS